MNTPQTMRKTKRTQCRLCKIRKICSPIFDHDGLSNKILSLLCIEILPTDKMSAAICLKCRKIVDNFQCFKDLCIKNQTEQPNSSVTERETNRKRTEPNRPKATQLPRAISVDTVQQENTSEPQNTPDNPSNNSNDSANVNLIQPVDQATNNRLSTASAEYCPNLPSPAAFHDSYETQHNHNIEPSKTSRNEPEKADSFECTVCYRKLKSRQELRTHRSHKHALGFLNKADDREKRIGANVNEKVPHESPAQHIKNQEICAVNSVSQSASSLNAYSLQQMQGTSSFSTNIDLSISSDLVTMQSMMSWQDARTQFLENSRYIKQITIIEKKR